MVNRGIFGNTPFKDSEDAQKETIEMEQKVLQHFDIYLKELVLSGYKIKIRTPGSLTWSPIINIDIDGWWKGLWWIGSYWELRYEVEKRIGEYFWTTFENAAAGRSSLPTIRCKTLDEPEEAVREKVNEYK